MNFLKLALPVTAVFLLFASAFADDDIPPRGQTGKITIITDPPNNDVFLNGEDLGKTPIKNRSFPSGRHTLIIMDQGKELVNIRFNVWPNKENVYETKTVMPSGNIEVTTIPSKCRVYLDGEIADRTDGSMLTLRNIDAGDHVVCAECPGYKAVDMMVKVKGEETDKITLNAKNGKKRSCE